MTHISKIGIFVDVQNIYYTTRQAYSKQFNYRAFWQDISSQGEIVTANAYAIKSTDNGQIKFQDALTHIGFNVKLKPFIQRSDGSAKGDWDVGITVDIMKCCEHLDRVILLSGDGDFDILLRHVNKSTLSEVYGVPELTAKSLKEAATYFNPITAELLR